MDSNNKLVDQPGTATVTPFETKWQSNYLAVLNNSFRLISRWGCRGFNCSQKTMDIIDSWATPIAAARENDNLIRIQTDVAACRHCSFCQFRRQAIPGQGRPDADLVFIGMAPNADEDDRGELYQGPAGQLLLKMIAAMKLSSQDVFFCHLIKCFPGETILSKTDALATCRSFLHRQLAVIKPKIICSLGEGPTQNLLDKNASISSLRGRFYTYGDARLMPTLDPAYLINHPEAKRLVWEDLKKIMAYLGVGS